LYNHLENTIFFIFSVFLILSWSESQEVTRKVKSGVTKGVKSGVTKGVKSGVTKGVKSGVTKGV